MHRTQKEECSCEQLEKVMTVLPVQCVQIGVAHKKRVGQHKEGETRDGWKGEDVLQSLPFAEQVQGQPVPNKIQEVQHCRRGAFQKRKKAVYGGVKMAWVGRYQKGGAYK